MADEYYVRIRGKEKKDDGKTVEVGTLTPAQAWHELPLPPCPDCRGPLAWDEAGHVPGTRTCDQCGSMFNVQTNGSRVFIRRERFYHP